MPPGPCSATAMVPEQPGPPACVVGRFPGGPGGPRRGEKRVPSLPRLLSTHKALLTVISKPRFRFFQNCCHIFPSNARSS